MSVDNRVVNMQFNNEEFEKRAGETKQTVDDLNESLNGLGRDADSGPLRNALNGVGDAVEGVGEKFNAFETFVAGIFLRLGSDVAEFGEKMVKSLSIDQVEAGFEKYQEKVSNVSGLKNVAKYQGYEYEDVLEVLDELSWYADATSYDMNAMTTALLSMTNSGADLKKAAKTIEGMANSFSYAGATATKVTGAFSMLSKAMGDGSKMGAMVYNSLSNVYKVMPAELEQKFIDTAVALGKLKKNSKGIPYYLKSTKNGLQEVEVTIGNFKDTLSEGWLDSKVLTKVYNTYGSYSRKIYKLQAQYKEQTGQILSTSEAMEMYNAQMLEAGKTIDEFGKNVFESAMEAKTFEEAVDATKDAVSSQFSAIFESIFGDYEKAKALFTDLNDWMVSTFAQPVANLAELVKQWSEFQTGLDDEGNIITARDNLIQAFKNIWGAYQSYVAPIRLAWRDLFPSLSVNGLVDFTLKFEEFTKKLKLGDEAAETIQTIAHAVFQLVKGGVGAFKILIDTAKTVLGYTKPLINIIESIALGIAGFIEKIAEFLDDIGLSEKLTSSLTKKFSTIKTKINDTYREFTRGGTVMSALTGAFEDAGVTLESFGNGLKNATKLFTDAINAEEAKINFNGVTTAAVGAFGTIATASATAAAKTKGFIDTLNSEDVVSKWQAFKDKITYVIEGILGNVIKLFQKLSSAFKDVGSQELTLYQKYMQDIQGQTTLFGKVLDAVITILKGYFTVGTVKSIGDFFTALTKGVESVNPLRSVANVFDVLAKKIDNFGKKTKAETFKDIAIGMLIMAAAMWALCKVSANPNLEAGLDLLIQLVYVVGVLAAVLAVASKVSGSMLGLGSTFAGLGVGLLLIASALNMMSNISNGQEAVQHLGGIMLAIDLMILIYNKTAKKKRDISQVGAMILKLGSGMLLIAEAMKIIGEIPEDQFKRGKRALIGILAIMALAIIAVTALDKFGKAGKGSEEASKSMAHLGFAFIGLGVAMGLLAIAMGAFSLIPFGKLIGSVVGITLLMAGFGALAHLVDSKDLLLAAASLAIIGVALQLMAVGLASLALLGKGILPGLGVLSAVVILLGLLATVGGMELFMTAAAIGVIAVAMQLLAASIAVLAALEWGQFLKGLAMLAIALFALCGVAMLMSPAIAYITAFMGALGLASLGIGNLVKTFLMAIAVIELIGPERLAKIWVDIITALCVAIIASVDPIVDALIALAYGIGKATIGIVAGLIQGIIDAGKAAWKKLFHPEEVTEGAGGALGKGLLTGFGKSLLGGSSDINITGLLDSTQPQVADASSDLGKTAADGIGNGIEENSSSVTDSLTDLFNEETSKEVSSSAGQVGSDAIVGLVDGMKSEDSYATKSIRSMFSSWLAEGKATWDEHSPSKEFAKIGKFGVLGLVKGLKDNSQLAEHAVVDMFNNTKDALRYAIDEIDSVMPTDDTLTIRPVLDLTEIQNGAGQIGRMLNGTTIDTQLQTNPLPASYMMASMGNDINDLRTVVSGIDLGKDNASIGEYVRSALEGMGVYMNGRQVGSMITGYQTNLGRARGL